MKIYSLQHIAFTTNLGIGITDKNENSQFTTNLGIEITDENLIFKC